MAALLVVAAAACGQATPAPPSATTVGTALEAMATFSPTATPTLPTATDSPSATATAPSAAQPALSPRPTRAAADEATATPTLATTASPEATPTGEATPSPTPSGGATPGPIQALQLWAGLSDSGATVGSTLVLQARVTDQEGRPVRGAAVVFIVRFPGIERAGIARNTDANGQTEQSFAVADAAAELTPGMVIAVDVWAIYSDQGATATASFVIR